MDVLQWTCCNGLRRQAARGSYHLKKAADLVEQGDMGLSSLTRVSRILKPLTLQRHRALIIAVLLWIPTVAYGLRILLEYSNSPGSLAAPPVEWPTNTGIRPRKDLATLLVFAHPRCPCSRSTIGELALIMARCRGKVDAFVIFYVPRSESDSWAGTDLWSDAANIPGVRAIHDPGGLETRRFHASTSGQALLYNSGARLVFNGGITAARGHFGANDGVDAVISILEEGTARRNTAPVFGCSLLGND
jgi:hypothetical protein